MEKYLLKFDDLKQLAGNDIKINEKVLWHVVWKNWRKIREYVYRKFRVSNMEDLIKLIATEKIKKRRSNRTIKDYC